MIGHERRNTLEAVEAKIKTFLDKWAFNEHMRQQMDIDLHFFIRVVMKTHDEITNPEAYSPERKNI